MQVSRIQLCPSCIMVIEWNIIFAYRVYIYSIQLTDDVVHLWVICTSLNAIYILVSWLRSIKNDLFTDKIVLVLGYNPWSVMVANGKIAILDKNMRCFISRNKYIHQSPTYTKKETVVPWIKINICIMNLYLWHIEAETNQLMAGIFLTCSTVFSEMKIYEFRLKVHWSLFLRVQ